MGAHLQKTPSQKTWIDSIKSNLDLVMCKLRKIAFFTHYLKLCHRLAHQLYLSGAPIIARIISELSHSETSIDIHPGADIGEGIFIDHGTGVVIGETSIIGRNVRIYQSVTLGAKRFELDERGALVKGNPRHPIIEDDVVIYAGATILGRITIGKGASVGGNVWLTHSVPAKSNITQAKAHTEIFHDGSGI
jgi:serine O-acetyltransferase